MVPPPRAPFVGETTKPELKSRKLRYLLVVLSMALATPSASGGLLPEPSATVAASLIPLTTVMGSPGGVTSSSGRRGARGGWGGTNSRSGNGAPAAKRNFFPDMIHSLPGGRLR